MIKSVVSRLLPKYLVNVKLVSVTKRRQEFDTIWCDLLHLVAHSQQQPKNKQTNKQRTSTRQQEWWVTDDHDE
jgi:hypothetical protein